MTSNFCFIYIYVSISASDAVLHVLYLFHVHFYSLHFTFASVTACIPRRRRSGLNLSVHSLAFVRSSVTTWRTWNGQVWGQEVKGQEVKRSQVGMSQVGGSKVGRSQVGRSKVGRSKVRRSKVRVTWGWRLISRPGGGVFLDLHGLSRFSTLCLKKTHLPWQAVVSTSMD